MEEWKTYKLEDLTTDGKGHYGIGAPAVDYDENKYTYLRITDINDDGSLNYAGLKSVDDPDASKYLLKKGDIVFARTGNSTGRSYYYEPSDGPLVFAGFLIKFSLDPVKVNPRFLKYYTHSKPYYDWVQSFDTGATRGNINAQTYGSMEINLPPRNVQDQLVDVLSSLDGKIALNNRINHNLEKQIQYRFDQMILADNTESVCQVADIIDINPRRELKKGQLARSIEMSYLSTSGSFPSGWVFKEYYGGMKFENGDTIMARITPCLENGKVAYIDFLENEEIAFGSTEYIVLRSKPGIPSAFTYFLARNNDFIDYATKNMNGSSGRQRVSGDVIGRYRIPFLNDENLASFAVVSQAAMNIIRNNSFENRRLAATRDTLLPFLLSGEISINSVTC